MFKEILVNVTEEETRVALLEDQILMELYIERSLNQRLVGSIYKGKVENVLPGMQAAFVDIGYEKNAFLYVDEALPQKEAEGKVANYNILDVVKTGQDLLVQIVKEPIGNKGPRVTTHITLPGRYLVLMPLSDYIGISRRIEAEEERERLRALSEKIKPEKMGVIVRTVAEGVSEEEIRQDMEILLRLWKRIQNKSASGPVPQLIHKDIDLVQRVIRDLFTEDIQRVSVDSPHVYEKILEILEVIGSQWKYKVQLSNKGDLFDYYNLQLEIDKLLKRRVWLKCGGYLVIDTTEALTSIDVNTGKFVGTRNLEDTVVRTNLEAAKEIARQLRLRNLGGIIIIDFIDMIDETHRQEVLALLEEEVKKDKTKTNILGITQLGLVEVTRKKVRHSLDSILLKTCTYCEGTGKTLSEESVSIEVKRQLADKVQRSQPKAILIETHPAVAGLLIGPGGSGLRELETRNSVEVLVKGNPEFHISQFEFKVVNSSEELLNNIPLCLGDEIKIRLEEPHASNINDAIGRHQGFVIHVEAGAPFLGETVEVEITRILKTNAKGRIKRILSL